MAASLSEEKEPFASSAAWACAVYSLVPFLGVVFVPFIFVFGVAAVLRGDPLDRRALAAGVLILTAQLVLWWLLYVAPTWSAVV
ncbi:MAG: hypothetical protein ABIR33_10485 [Pyrinomonadaceae bacterium]